MLLRMMRVARLCGLVGLVVIGMLAPAAVLAQSTVGEEDSSLAGSSSMTHNLPKQLAEPATQRMEVAGSPALLSLLPHDLSPWSMFLNSDVVVKVVLVGLACASFATWTICLAKTMQLMGARRHAVRVLRGLAQATSLNDLGQDGLKPRSGAVVALMTAAVEERRRSERLSPEGIKERAAIALGRLEAREVRRMTRGTGILATIGSTAPFIGLFGTVWGIMNAFVGISRAHTTNLAVVAPGIAEALLATAIGLVAAIPAVVIYNGFARSIASYKALLSDASAEIMQQLSRDLDRQLAPAE